MSENNTTGARPLAIVTGASTGIGRELARVAAEKGYDLIICANEPTIHEVAREIGVGGVQVTPVEAELSTLEGVDTLYDAALGRPIDVLCANAGSGMGHAFLDQPFDRVRHTVDTNITGTIYLIHKVGRDMRARNAGKMLVTGSIAGFMPGAFQAVYNGTKAFIDSFCAAMREEWKDTAVTMTCLMPGATETDFFARADMLDTNVGTAKKDDPAMVAQVGFDAMLKGEGDVVSGWKNKLMAAAAHVTPAGVLARAHRGMAEPGSGKP